MREPARARRGTGIGVVIGVVIVIVCNIAGQ
jgi:hypothetical protein